MIFIRSLLYNLFVFAWTVAWLVLILWLFLPFSPRSMRRAVRIWAIGAIYGLKIIVGLGFEVRGQENIPKGPAILASKHQSAWDTAIFYLLVDDPIYVMKRELLSIPLWGWYAKKARSIGIDRKAGASALRHLVEAVEDRVNKGWQVIIFPEGTRTRPGDRRPYHPGIAAVYARTQAPVVPIALNSGVFWGRRSFAKKPGRITIQFLPPIPPGLDRRTFMARLEECVEAASDRLAKEAMQGL